MSEKQLTQESIESGANKNKFGILTGVNLYMLSLKFNPNFSGQNKNNFLPDPGKEISLITGLTYDRLLFRKSDRFSIRLDLLYTKQTFYSYGERTNKIGGISRDDAFYSFTGIKTPVLLQYSITGRRIVPYINAGIAYQIFIDNSYHHIEEAENMWHEIRTSEDNNMLFKTGEISGAGGVGIRTRLFNNINLHLLGRVEFGPGLFVNVHDEAPWKAKLKPYVQNSLQSTFLLGITF
jgi:hypothetical protein